MEKFNIIISPLTDLFYQKKHFKGHDKYPHIVSVETAKTAKPQRRVSLESILNGTKTMDMEGLLISFIYLFIFNK